jgi:hypothetical protein
MVGRSPGITIDLTSISNSFRPLSLWGEFPFGEFLYTGLLDPVLQIEDTNRVVGFGRPPCETPDQGRDFCTGRASSVVGCPTHSFALFPPGLSKAICMNA